MAFLFVPIPFCCFQPLQCAAAGLWFVKEPRTAVPPVSRAVVMQGLIRWMFLPEIDIWRRVRSSMWALPLDVQIYPVEVLLTVISPNVG